jgi:beta-lactamase class A
MRARWLASWRVAAAIACAGVVSIGAGAPTADVAPLQKQVEALAAAIHGDVGITIRHIESAQGFDRNGDRQYPTASMYKVPIMVEAFRLAAAGKLSLTERVTLRRDMLHFSSILARFDPGLSPTIRDLIFWMITESENGATDILLERVGAENVTNTMRQLGLRKINVNRTVRLMMCDYTGIDDPRQRSLRGEAFEKMYDARPAAAYYGRMWRDPSAPIPDAVKKFNADPQDVASPNDLSTLMRSIFEGKVVSPDASRQMLDIMLQTRFFPELTPGLLPAGTRVARKAGTLPTSLGETAIIYLPDDKGHVIVTVMDNNLRETRETGSRFIAQVARAAYDHFTSGTPATPRAKELDE